MYFVIKICLCVIYMYIFYQMAERTLAQEIAEVIAQGVTPDIAAQIVAAERARRAGSLM